jgi:3-mercaptopyruvate sulfurtransferase SseA
MTALFYGRLASPFSARIRATSIAEAIALMSRRSPIRGMADVCAQLQVPDLATAPRLVAAFSRRTDRIPVAVFDDGEELSAHDALRHVMRVHGRSIEKIVRSAALGREKTDVVYVSRTVESKIFLRASAGEAAAPTGLLARGIWWVFGAPGAEPVAVLCDGEVVTDQSRIADAKKTKEIERSARRSEAVAAARKKLGLTS